LKRYGLIELRRRRKRRDEFRRWGRDRSMRLWQMDPGDTDVCRIPGDAAPSAANRNRPFG